MPRVTAARKALSWSSRVGVGEGEERQSPCTFLLELYFLKLVSSSC